MSDDRFKQARRSLIDRNNQRRQQGGEEMADDDFYEDEKTLMVSMDSVTGGPGAGPAQPSGPGQAPAHPPAPAEDDFEDAATQMIDINGFEQLNNGVEESTQPHRDAYETATQQMDPVQQHFGPAPGAGAGAQFVPDSEVAGHQGHTDFINIDELAGANAPGAPSHAGGGGIINDPVLSQAYQFGPQSIQEGEITLIFAQNPLGKPVVLRRIWADDPNSMPSEWRERLSQLESLKIPGLVSLNGVIASQSGVWAELSKPEGYRLSAVLEQHGPQSAENVIGWLKQSADIIEAIHAAGLLYLNLTLDAIWIQADDSIVVEPFDLLSFDKRGNLGDFGPVELRRPPQDRQLSPATDVYTLAAVSTTALTGLPFSPQNLDHLEDQKLAKGLRSALSDNPTERPQSMGEFSSKFKAPSGGGAKFDFDFSELDIKVVAAIAVVLLGAFGGYMYWNKQQAEKAAAERARIQAAQQAEPTPPVEAAQNPDPAPGSENAENADSPPAVPTPGDVVEDPRIRAITSYRSNPPSADQLEVALSPEEIATQSGELLDTARAHIKEGDKLASGNNQRDAYRSALVSVTESIRLHNNSPTEDEQKLLAELSEKKVIQQYEEKQRDRIAKAIKEKNVGGATRAYKNLSTMDFHAKSSDFFKDNPSATVRALSGGKTPDKADSE